MTLKHIVGLLKPDKGHVYVHGKDVPSLPARELAGVRKTMGFLFQNAALFDSITVGENVAFPLRRHTDWPDEKIRSVARAKLADVGLENDYDKMPGDLSGGMKKRAGLARAIALDPDILLADEPSAGLDPITSDEIDELLLDLKKKGTTLVMVTHNVPSARHVADELAMLHEGRVIARGTRGGAGPQRQRTGARVHAVGECGVDDDATGRGGAEARSGSLPKELATADSAPTKQIASASPRLRGHVGSVKRRSEGMNGMISSRAVGAGAFVVLGVVLFTAALFMIGSRRMLFEDRFPDPHRVRPPRTARNRRRGARRRARCGRGDRSSDPEFPVGQVPRAHGGP